MNDNNLFHLGFNPAHFSAKYAVLPGDPARTDMIAAQFDNAQIIANNREYKVWIAEYKSEKVFVCSTGIGGPSAAIAVEELFMAGVRTFVRVGTCGAMQPHLKGGDLIIVSAAVRQEGTTLHYAPIEYPAAADFSVTNMLDKAAKNLGRTAYVGVAQSKDSFYGQHDPERMPVADKLLCKWNAFKKLGVLASEMECAAVFTVSASLGAKAGAVLHVVWNQETEKEPNTEVAGAVKTATDAIKMMIDEGNT